MLVAAPILCALLATLQVPTGALGDGFAGSRVRGLDRILEVASGLEDRLSQGQHWASSFTYGETASGPSSQYNGRVYDPGTGFHDYGARLYWPEIGRFISADSVMGSTASPMTLNRYSYVLNNPYKYIDPTGHAAIRINRGASEARAAEVAASMAAVSVDENQPLLVRAGAAVVGTFAAGLDSETAWKTELVLNVGMIAAAMAPSKGPGFVVTPKGEAIPIPDGAAGPVPVKNGKGFQYTGGSGGKGLNSRVSGVRIMEPTPAKGPSPGYPGGYVSYENAGQQTVNPQTGQTVAPSDPSWHIPMK